MAVMMVIWRVDWKGNDWALRVVVLMERRSAVVRVAQMVYLWAAMKDLQKDDMSVVSLAYRLAAYLELRWVASSEMTDCYWVAQSGL